LAEIRQFFSLAAGPSAAVCRDNSPSTVALAH
jgi:hypothetical protein